MFADGEQSTRLKTGDSPHRFFYISYWHFESHLDCLLMLCHTDSPESVRARCSMRMNPSMLFDKMCGSTISLIEWPLKYPTSW